MKKTPSVFLRNPSNMSELTLEPNPEADWVFKGYGTATRKFDGTCVMLDEYKMWWARREVKGNKPDPEGFVFLGEDEITHKRMGWVPINPQGYFHPLAEALGADQELALVDDKETWPIILAKHSDAMAEGTYELMGPKIGANPEGLAKHQLVRHNDAQVLEEHPDILAAGRDSDYIIETVTGFAASNLWEGVVWHHEDGRYAKLKVRDFTRVRTDQDTVVDMTIPKPA